MASTVGTSQIIPRSCNICICLWLLVTADNSWFSGTLLFWVKMIAAPCTAVVFLPSTGHSHQQQVGNPSQAAIRCCCSCCSHGGGQSPPTFSPCCIFIATKKSKEWYYFDDISVPPILICCLPPCHTLISQS